jgi:RNA polymerase sigma factor (sigma-70 family)
VVSHADADFDAAFRRLFVLAFGVANSLLRDRDEAEDAAAETMARALVAWRRIRDGGYVDAWVARVAANVAIDTTRRRLRAAPVTAEVAAGPEIGALDRMVLADALAKVSRRQRDVLVLRYVSDLSEAEVAAALGLSAGSVKRYAHRGLARLRRDVTRTDADGFVTAKVVQVAVH